MFRRHLLGLGRTVHVLFYRARGKPVPIEVRESWLFASFLRAAQRYRPSPYRGRICVVRAADGDAFPREFPPDMGWGEVAAGGLEVHEVPGGHHSLMQEPNVQTLSCLIDDVIERGD
jgi:aspartate racemase